MKWISLKGIGGTNYKMSCPKRSGGGGGGVIREGELQHKSRLPHSGFIREGGLNRAFTVVWVARRTSTINKAL